MWDPTHDSLLTRGAKLAVLTVMLCLPQRSDAGDPASQADEILRASKAQGGLIVHVGCGTGKLSAALRSNDRYLVQGLAQNDEDLQAAREHIGTLGLAGPVTIKAWDGGRLPYTDNLVNLLVLDKPGVVSDAEAMRVLAPRGAVCVRTDAVWTATAKSWPDNIDQWTHYLYGPQNNAVAKDTAVGPPQHFQWTCGPRFSRSHDHLASMSAMVSSGGRVFYIVDDAPAAFAGATARWRLVARDAFSGVALWEREISPWEHHLRDFRSGPADIARRLVAIDDRVFVTLGYGKPVVALDAATGEIAQSYKGTESTQEILVDNGTLWLVLGDRDHKWQATEAKELVSQTDYIPPFERTTPPTGNKRVMAVDATTGETLWTNAESYTRELMPSTLATAAGQVYYQTTEAIVCLDASNGKQVWQVKRPIQRRRLAWSSPTLVVYDGIVFSADRRAADADGKLLWLPSGGYHEYIKGPDAEGELIALDAQSGEQLWSCPVYEGFNSPVDVMIADGLLWTGNYAWGDGPGITEALDPKTGQVVRRRPPDSEFLPKIGHARCHRAKATERFLILGRRGVEFVDVKTGDMTANRWVRGICQYGVMPANGLLYVPPHSCACSINDMLKSGFMALAPARSSNDDQESVKTEERLVRGPAFGADPSPLTLPTSTAWPTYRGDAARKGVTKGKVPQDLTMAWQADLGGKLTSPVVANDTLIVAQTNEHQIHAIDATNGDRQWSFQAAARIDSPPSIAGGSVLFGSNDGYVYCLRQTDGQLIWRFRAAPHDQQIVANNQLESAWPVSGSVLVIDDAAYFAVGRSSYLDGGMWVYKLDVATGATLNTIDLSVEAEVSDHGIAGQGSLPDVLSSDGQSIFMRNVRFDLDLVRQKSDVPHLYSPVGFLDDDWWHRTYWQIGSDMKSGWGGWSKAGQQRPAGRLLVTDGDHVYGWGRDQYDIPGAHVGVDAEGVWGPIGKQQGRWTYLHLFAASLDARPPKQQRRESSVPSENKWSRRVPVIGRAMVLGADTLFVAGPVDPLEAVPHEPAGADALVKAIETNQGGRLLAVRTNDGVILSELDLDSPPVFDGMAAADGRLYLSTRDGHVVCLGR